MWQRSGADPATVHRLIIDGPVLDNWQRVAQIPANSHPKSSAGMEQLMAVQGLSALADETRLRIFCLLEQRGSSGLVARDIAAELAISPASVTRGINHLVTSGIVRKKRTRDVIAYAINTGFMSGLVQFLLSDCCGGHPERCGVSRSRRAIKKRSQ